MAVEYSSVDKILQKVHVKKKTTKKSKKTLTKKTPWVKSPFCPIVNVNLQALMLYLIQFKS